MAQVEFGLHWLVSPVTRAAFKRNYWERRPLVIQRSDATYFAGLLTLPEVEELLRSYEIMPDVLRLVKDGTDLSLANVGTGIERPIAAFRSGATIVLHGLQRMHFSLSRLCNALSNDVSCDFQVNAYLTPGSKKEAQGLGIHYDTHDVFIAQLAGSKLWKIYHSPVKLPLESHPHDPEAKDKGSLIHECELKPGDCLYIPRGFYHCAKVSKTPQASLHLTIGVHPTKWSDLIATTLRCASEREARLRESLPLGFARDKSTLPDIRRRFHRMLAELSASPHLDAALDAIVSDLGDRQRPLLNGHFADLEACKALRVNTRVRRRSEIAAEIAVKERSINLRFHGKVVRMPARLSHTLDFIAHADVFCPGDLPGKLKNSEKLVLVRRLLEEGYLTAMKEELGRSPQGRKGSAPGRKGAPDQPKSLTPRRSLD
ncbi:MAG: bifunctional lysine-specific demethylase and histidyl-hydroxylase [Alphaproteobacteria bacterium]|jgi:ribosomal protein L16 Arg81 hydroxylase|nr:bifunctional lysine-specific demethylase and histidyl-hydroxylase [Alphaproteobacteria bacterium]